MSDLADAAAQAVRMIASGDREVVAAVSASLRFSVASTALASALGIPAGVALASARFRLRRLVVDVLNTMLAVPTVVIGLFVYTLVFSQGPLGRYRLLFTPAAIVLGQVVLILPLVTALVCGAVSVVDPAVRTTARTLGAGAWRATWTVAREARTAIVVATVTAFGRVVGEVGISMILGGNIAGYTRTITTAIALQTSKGEFALGLALGMVLLAVAFSVNVAIRLLGGRRT